MAWGLNWGGPGAYRDIGLVRQRFAEMRALGANTVRVHLQFGDVMESPTRANPRQLAHIGAIVHSAEREGLYLDISGNEVWLPASAPAWYGRLGEADRWEAQATYWSEVARVCAPSPAVFCFDLLSEPIVGHGVQPGDWYAGHFGGYYFGQRISLDLAGRTRDEVARAWTSQLVEVIRAHDQRHLITVGMLPDMNASGFHAGAVAPELDFLSVHLYPRTGRAAESIELVKQLSAIGKPVLVEETYPLRADAPTVGRFIVATRPYAAGWLGFYFPQVLESPRGARSKIAQAWLRLFRTYAPTLARTPGHGLAH
jgi:cellulase (glycosyl hydrolase family 5)